MTVDQRNIYLDEENKVYHVNEDGNESEAIWSEEKKAYVVPRIRATHRVRGQVQRRNRQKKKNGRPTAEGNGKDIKNKNGYKCHDCGSEYHLVKSKFCKSPGANKLKRKPQDTKRKPHKVNPAQDGEEQSTEETEEPPPPPPPLSIDA